MNQSFSKISIVVVLGVLIVGGIFAWQYFGAPKEEVKTPEISTEKYCEKDEDCVCGVHKTTRDCFYGNKNYVDTAQQCPDFCSGITGKLKISCVNKRCEQVSETTAVHGNLSAFAREKDGRSYMILVEGSNEVVVEQTSANVEVGGVIFGDPKFSPQWDYLTYITAGWEWTRVKIYNVKDKKIIKELAMPSLYGFTPDGKYFYACADSDIGEPVKYGRIYDVPNFNVKYDIETQESIKGYYFISCQYNKNKNTIRYDIVEDYPKNSRQRIIEYFFDTGKSQEVSK